MKKIRQATALIAVSFIFFSPIVLPENTVLINCMSDEEYRLIIVRNKLDESQLYIDVVTSTGANVHVEQSSGEAMFELDQASFPATVVVNKIATWIVENDCSLRRE